MTALEGINSAMVTPLTPGGEELDEDALRSLVDRTIDEGVDGLVPCGGTGEFPALSHQERRRVVEVVCEQAGGRVPVIAHTGAGSTAEAIALSQHAEASGADAVMLIIPFYEPITSVEVSHYYAAVSKAVDLPLIAYNHPGSTGYNQTSLLLRQLSRDIENLAYAKDSSGDLGQLFEHTCGDDCGITVLNGMDSLLGPALLLGVKGAIMGGVNFLCPAFAQMMRAAREDDVARLVDLWRAMYPIAHFLEVHPYIPAVKAGCEIIGHPAGPARSPMQPLSTAEYTQLESLLASFFEVTSASTGVRA